MLDWGRQGLRETLEVLRGAGVKTAGAGRTQEEAERPAVLDVPGKGRVIVFSLGAEDSGIPPEWTPGQQEPGVDLLPDYSRETARRLGPRVRAARSAGDVVIVSLHWGGNWGYRVPSEHRAFAHALIDEAEVDVVHGHSSHHPRGVEVYHGRPILHGCGDFLNDYEGIHGYEQFRGDLTLMYFVSLEPGTGRLEALRMRPMQVRHFRLRRASATDTA